MKQILLIFMTFFSLQHMAIAGPEILLGMDAGHIDFEDATSSDKDEYGSFNIGFHLGYRLSFTVGKIGLGFAGAHSWNDMNLLRGTTSGADNTFSQLYYGPHIGIYLSDQYRLNLEYYTHSSHKFLWAEGKSANYFTKGDELIGIGYGIGLSKTDGRFIYDLMFQKFLPEDVDISGSEYSAKSDKFSDHDIVNISFSIGLLI